MARIGIVTIHDMRNIGNRLQHFALSEMVRELGHEPFTIPNTPYAGVAPVSTPPAHESRSSVAPRMQSPVTYFARKAAAKVTSAVRKGSLRELPIEVRKAQRMAALSAFSKRHTVSDATHVAGPKDAAALDSRYDAFIVGSDQVWNPDYRGGCPTDFLTFTHPDRRIAYAASFVHEQLSERYFGHYSRMLQDFVTPSVREQSGVELFRALTGRDCPLVLDPTLMLDRSRWETLADKAPTPSRRPYVACYLLKQTSSTKDRVRAFASSQGLDVVDILAPRSLRTAAYGAEAFLRTIRDADFVITDSFHATVFSLLFGTPFTNLKRDSLNDRIDTLLSTLGVNAAEARELPEGTELAKQQVPDISEPLKAAQEHSWSFLKTALEPWG